MRLLVSDFIKNNKDQAYFESFQKDISGWQFALANMMSELKHNSTYHLIYIKDDKKEKAFISEFLNLNRIDLVIEETISNVHLMAYRYGVLNKDDTYKNIHSCKFIGGFIYYFMQNLPIVLSEEVESNGLCNRRVNAIVAYHCMIQLMALDDDPAVTKKNYETIYNSIGKEIRLEIIHRLVKRPLLEEWIYVYCRTLKQMINIG